MPETALTAWQENADLRPVTWLEAFAAHHILIWSLLLLIGGIFVAIAASHFISAAAEATSMRRVALTGVRADGISTGVASTGWEFNHVRQYRLVVDFQDSNGNHHWASSLAGPAERFADAPNGAPVMVMYDPEDPRIAFLEFEVMRAR